MLWLQVIVMVLAFGFMVWQIVGLVKRLRERSKVKRSEGSETERSKKE